MKSRVSMRYALRSLQRNLRRTLLSVVGTTVGVAVGLFAVSWIRGQESVTIGSAAAGGIGHLRLVPPGWLERRDDKLRLDDWQAELGRLREAAGVRVAAPRSRTSGLLGLGTRSVHVQLTGVDADTEPRALRYVREIRDGRYLRPGERGAVVIGRTHAERLDAIVDDELVVTTVDREGEMRSMLLVVVGIAETGSRDIDASIAHLALEDVEELSGIPGAGEITLLIDDVHSIDEQVEALASGVSGDNALVTWREVAPELRAGVENDAAFYTMAMIIVLVVVLLGVASAQLTGVLQRRREFAVLAAVGMRRASLVRVVVTEGIALGLLSALAALALMAPLLWNLSTDGIDLSTVVGGDEGVALGGVLIDPMFYPDFGGFLVPLALVLALSATITASLYPAWFASRTDPATALRVDR